MDQFVVASSSLLLDSLYLMLLFSIARKRKVIRVLPFALMYIIRFAIQHLCYLPTPKNYVWNRPSVPSLTIFYEPVGDFYPSGHVALSVLAFLYFRRLDKQVLAKFATVCTIYQILVLLATNSHYCIDILGGATLGYTSWHITRKYTFPCKHGKRTIILRPSKQD